MSGVFCQRQTLIGQIEKDDRRSEHSRLAEHLNINDVSNADKHEDEHFAADAFEAHFAGQLLIDDGAHNTSDIVADSKDNQGNQQPVTSSKEVAQPSSDSGKS